MTAPLACMTVDLISKNSNDSKLINGFTFGT